MGSEHRKPTLITVTYKFCKKADSSGQTHRNSPLIVAIVHCNLPFVKVLLELGAHVNLVRIFVLFIQSKVGIQIPDT